MTLDLQTYIESGGLASTVIYYVFTFISFESILGITNGLISTPVEEGPVERITEGLQRGGKTRWKLFYIQIFTCLAGLSCPESQRNGIMFVFGLVPSPILYPTVWSRRTRAQLFRFELPLKGEISLGRLLSRLLRPGRVQYTFIRE